MPPKSSCIRVPSGQAARNNAIGDDSKLKRTCKTTVAEPEASPSLESSPAKKKICIRVVSKALMYFFCIFHHNSCLFSSSSDYNGQGDENAVEEKPINSAQSVPAENSNSNNDDADDDAAAIASADDVEGALSSLPASKKTRSKKAKRGKKKATSFSTDDKLPPANEIPFVTLSGVQIVAKPMKSKATKTPKATKTVIIDNVINLSSGNEGLDKPNVVVTKGHVKGHDKDPASKITSKIGTATKSAGLKTTSVTETPKTPTTPKAAIKSLKLNCTALQAALASPFKPKPKVQAETSKKAENSADMKVHDEIYKYNHSFHHDPVNMVGQLNIHDMALHYDLLYHDVKLAGAEIVPCNVSMETYVGDYVDTSPKKIGAIFALYGEADVTYAALSFVKDANYINAAWASPLDVDLNKSGVLCRVTGSTLSSRAAQLVSVGMVHRCNFVNGVAGIKDKLKHSLTFAFFPLDALRLKGFLGVVTGEELLVVQGVDIDSETYISMDTRQIDENHSKATVYKWTKNGRRMPSSKDSLDYTDIVPIFDLRVNFDITKDMENISKFPVWPHLELEPGSKTVELLSHSTSSGSGFSMAMTQSMCELV
ncbi:hypothetical protein C8J56DRAFT_1045196 [Mycena floridula]|nr:hypothetical protein C8J56DRAFT_1045196 [Mycena floridula]